MDRWTWLPLLTGLLLFAAGCDKPLTIDDAVAHLEKAGHEVTTAHSRIFGGVMNAMNATAASRPGVKGMKIVMVDGLLVSIMQLDDADTAKRIAELTRALDGSSSPTKKQIDALMGEKKQVVRKNLLFEFRLQKGDEVAPKVLASLETLGAEAP